MLSIALNTNHCCLVAVSEQCVSCCRITVSPNGVAWAPHEARQGVVPRLLREILQTRIMVKAAMKRHPPSAKVDYPLPLLAFPYPWPYS